MADTTERDNIRGVYKKGGSGDYGSFQPDSTQHCGDDGLSEKTTKSMDYGQSSVSAVYRVEIKDFFHLSWPIVITCFLNAMPSFLAVSFCGHLGTTELNAAALAASLIYITGTVIAFGMSTACDTYFAQYHGSVNRHKLGVVLQKAILILLLSFVPCVAVHLNAETLLILMGQNHEEARLSGRYLLIAIPGNMAVFILFGLAKFLMCQNVVIPGIILTSVGISVNVILHYCLVIAAGLGIDGSAIAYSISYWLMMILFVIYIRYSGILNHTWEGWSLECLEEWGNFFMLGILGAVIIALDAWCLEVTFYLAGLLGEIELGAQAMMFVLNGVAGFTINGLGTSAGIRVGNTLGAGNRKAAILATKVSMGFAVVFGAILFILLCSLKGYVPYIFSSDSDVVDLASTLLPVMSFRLLFMACAFTIQGQLRGCARQALDATIAVSGHVVSLVMGITLMFLTSMELMGMWTGYTCGMFVEAIIGLIVLVTTDWEYQVQRALKLTGSIPSDKQEQNVTAELQTLPDDTSKKVPLASKEKKSVPAQESSGDGRAVTATTVCKRLAAVFVVLFLLVTGVVTRITVDLYDPSLDTNSTNTAQSQSEAATLTNRL